MSKPEQYTDKQKKELLAILGKDRGKCIYCNKKLSMYDSIFSGEVCGKCVHKNHMRAIGRMK